MKSLKEKFNLIFGFLCIAGVLTVVGMYIVSCTSNEDIETIRETPNVTIKELTSIEEFDSALIAFMYGTLSRGLDVPDIESPSLELDPELGPIRGYTFNDEDTGVSAQITQNSTDDSMLYCSFNTEAFSDKKIFKVKDHKDNSYTIYDENNVALIKVTHNINDNTIVLKAIISTKETEQLLCGVTTAAVGHALGTAAAFSGPIGWAFVVSWATISYFICK